MKIFRKANSIQSSLLLHELSFVLLIFITASVGIVWAYAWQNSSEESLRLTAMNSHVQNIRSGLYRQLKEVFDAVFLHDEDAADEYEHYTTNIQQYLQRLSALHQDAREAEATKAVALAYARFQQETNRLLQPVNLTSEQRYMLDKQLERFTFTELETAFRNYEQLLAQKQLTLAENRSRWVTRITVLAPVPVLLAVWLLFLSRRYVRSNVLKPLASVMQGARRISKGELQHKLPYMGVDELVRLAEAINKMAEELSLSRDRLIEAKKQAALGELVPLVAHNIRNPLAGIRAVSQLTLDDNVSEATNDALKDIIMAVDRLERWVTSLLTYLHPLQPHFIDARLTALVDEVVALMSLQLQEKNIEIVRQGWKQSALISVDASLLEQTIHNLLQNSIEASAVNSQITMRYQDYSENVQLSISDTGVGMKYDPVAEEVVDGQKKRLSCGLGIPFALKVIKQHNGSLSYQPVAPQGTCVTITLPLKQTVKTGEER